MPFKMPWKKRAGREQRFRGMINPINGLPHSRLRAEFLRLRLKEQLRLVNLARLQSGVVVMGVPTGKIVLFNVPPKKGKSAPIDPLVERGK